MCLSPPPTHAHVAACFTHTHTPLFYEGHPTYVRLVVHVYVTTTTHPRTCCCCCLLLFCSRSNPMLVHSVRRPRKSTMKSFFLMIDGFVRVGRCLCLLGLGGWVAGWELASERIVAATTNIFLCGSCCFIEVVDDVFTHKRRET